MVSIATAQKIKKKRLLLWNRDVVEEELLRRLTQVLLCISWLILPVVIIRHISPRVRARVCEAVKSSEWVQ